MLKLVGIPLHPLEKGVITNLPVMGIPELLVAVNVIELPAVEPAKAIPILLLLFVQEKLVLFTKDPIKGRVMSVPEHTILSVMGLMEGKGFTTILNDRLVPEQPLLKGVTVNNAEIGTLKILVVVKLLIVPDPVISANPMFELLLVQLYCVPPTIEPVNEIPLLTTPEQNTADETGFTTGVGFTQMVNCTGIPEQLFEIGVTNKLEVMGMPEKLVVVKAPIEPEPDKPIPIKELSFVH
jgi:hypothetical protein